MLQVVLFKNVESNSDGNSRIQEILDNSGVQEILGNSNVLATFDKVQGKIDLSCLEGHVGERILVSHYIRENGKTKLDYERERTLTEVGMDENGIQFIQYE